MGWQWREGAGPQLGRALTLLGVEGTCCAQHRESAEQEGRRGSSARLPG